MITREEAEGLILRVASSAFDHYPGKTTAEPGYTIDEDIDWCLDAVPSVSEPYRTTIRDRIAMAIADPTAQRQAFTRDVLALVTGRNDQNHAAG